MGKLDDGAWVLRWSLESHLWHPSTHVHRTVHVTEGESNIVTWRHWRAGECLEDILLVIVLHGFQYGVVFRHRRERYRLYVCRSVIAL